MTASCTKSTTVFKSPLRTVVRFLLRSRDLKAEKCRRLKRRLDETNLLLGCRELELDQTTAQLRQLQRQVRQLVAQKNITRGTQIDLPADPPIGTHGYGARMVCLAVELAQAVGFRGAERVLRIVFDWLGVEQKLPSFSTIRHWIQRLGVAALNEPISKANAGVW